MKFDSWMLLALMLLKSISVVPLIAQDYGIAIGAMAMAFNVVSYSLLIWATQRESRSSSASIERQFHFQKLE